MNYIYYNFNVSGFYVFEQSSNREMLSLGDFLVYDAPYNVQRFITWITDPYTVICSSNMSILEKNEGNIFISNLYPVHDHLFFSISAHLFIDILKKWEDLQTSSLAKIMIAFNKGVFTITTIDKQGDSRSYFWD